VSAAWVGKMMGFGSPGRNDLASAIEHGSLNM